MWIQYLFVTFIITNVYTIDWKAIQSHGSLPDVPLDKCEIGKYYKLKCNVCECISPGIPKCGTLRCVGDIDFIQRRGIYDEGGCAIGTNFYDWCNMCRCVNGNAGMCTRMQCHE